MIQKQEQKQLAIGKRVSYKNQYGERIGTVIEIDERGARIKWDGRKLRTWIRLSALKLVTSLILLLSVVSCSKTIPFTGTDTYPIIIKTCKEWEHKSRIGKYPFAGDSVCTNWKLDTIYGKFKRP